MPKSKSNNIVRIRESTDAIIIWTDLDNYTAICEFLTSKGYLRKFMLAFYEKIADTIDKVKIARREKFVGDGVLVVLPIPRKDDLIIEEEYKHLDPGKFEELKASQIGFVLVEELNRQINYLAISNKIGLLTWKDFLKPVLKGQSLKMSTGMFKGKIIRIPEPNKGKRYEICGEPINIACRLASLDEEYSESNVFIGEEISMNLQNYSPTERDIEKYKKGEEKLRHVQKNIQFRYN